MSSGFFYIVPMGINYYSDDLAIVPKIEYTII